MRKQLFKLCMAAVLLIFGFTGLFAQSDLTSAGGDASGGGGSLSFSVGQVNYTMNSGTTGNVLQGVQQPYDILVTNSTEKGIEIDLTVSAFPNPVMDRLILKVEYWDAQNLSLHYQLYGLNGQLIEVKKIASTNTNINVRNLRPSIYFLAVYEKDKEIKNFKIVKK